MVFRLELQICTWQTTNFKSCTKRSNCFKWSQMQFSLILPSIHLFVLYSTLIHSITLIHFSTSPPVHSSTCPLVHSSTVPFNTPTHPLIHSPNFPFSHSPPSHPLTPPFFHSSILPLFHLSSFPLKYLLIHLSALPLLLKLSPSTFAEEDSSPMRLI